MRVSGGPRPVPGTLNKMFLEAVAKYDKPDALMYKASGKYVAISHRELETQVRRIALALQAQGLGHGDRVAILSHNRPEWAACDYAILSTGMIAVPVYPSIPADQVRHILSDSASAAVILEDESQAEKLAEIRSTLPDMQFAVCLGTERLKGCDATLAEIEKRGEALENDESIAQWRGAAMEIAPDEPATIIYTSGTTGNPKGVVLSHDNLYSNVMAAKTVIPFSNDVSLSFLPLSHSFERMAGHFLMFAVGASIAYAESIDTVPVNMVEVRPTFVLSVPRLYEKMYARVLETALSGSWLKRQIFFWARGIAERWADRKLAGQEVGGVMAVQYRIADSLVFSKLRARTGGRLRFFVSGGAPLAPEINKFFYSAGLMILEGYGLTETSPVLCVNTPANFRIGTVGKPVNGIELKIGDDGEILARGPNIMQGYYRNPEATAEAIDAEGWFHTGDIGQLNDGFLTVTDRKKDIIVTAGGKNIAPQNVENMAKTSKYVNESVMLGDRRKYPIMLVVPNFEILEKWARQQNLSWSARSQLISMPEVQGKMEKEVQAVLHGLAGYEMPKKYALLERDFSIERGEITPSMKVKRRVIERDYKQIIDRLYEE